MNDLQIFNNDEFGEVRAIEINGEPWFVGKDIADKLEYQNGSRDITRHVDEEDRQIIPVFDGVQNRETWIINESGLYSLILGSKLPEAKKFKHWVTSEVLPKIRQTGGFNLPQSFSEALQLAADQAKRIELLEKKNNELIPKAEFFDAVTDSKTAISIGETAKVLDAGIGQNKLFAFLRDNNILKSDNTPYQRYIDMGYFRVVEQKYEVHGEIKISIKTLVFQKGIDFIRRLLNKKGAA
jgi:prophage antirepressor-like protein